MDNETSVKVNSDAESGPIENSRSIERKRFLGRNCCFSQETFNILWMGYSFFMIVWTFLATQNFQSQLNADVGFIALSILYAGLAVGSLMATSIVEFLGEKTIFFIGGSGFVFFIAANIKVIPAVLYIASLYNGFTGSLFWVAQGTYLNKMTTLESRGSMTSVFVAFLATGHFIGNGMPFVIQHFPNFNFAILFIITAVGSSIGMLSMANLEPAPRNPNRKPFLTNIGATFKILIDTDAIFLYPSILAYGFNLTFVFGIFPAKVNDTIWSSMCLTIFGLVHMLVSVRGGLFAPFLKGNFLMTLVTVGQTIGIILTTIATPEKRYLYAFAGAFLGTIEGGFLIQTFISFGESFSDRLTSINSALRFLSGAAMAVMFFVSTSVSYEIRAYFILGVQWFALLMLYIRAFRKTKMVTESVEIPKVEKSNEHTNGTTNGGELPSEHTVVPLET